MKKRNGFTLVELLVVIALMLSILGIAIVNLVNVSDKKKEEAWNEVISQIETAAVNYFEDNEYLFEGLDITSKGSISVKKLVSEDYLNKITDPRSGKSISSCSIVSITKTKDNKYKSNFDVNSINAPEGDCDKVSIIITSKTGKIEMRDTSKEINSALSSECRKKGASGNEDNGPIVDESETNGYCYSKWFELDVGKLNKKGEITSAKYCNTDSGLCDTDNGVDIKKNGNKYVAFNGYYENTTDSAKTIIDLYNQSGALTRIVTSPYKIDHTNPSGLSIEVTNTKAYNNSRPNIKVKGKDDESLIEHYVLVNAKSKYHIKEFYDEKVNSFEETFDKAYIYENGSLLSDFGGGTANISLIVYDMVGNSSTINTTYNNYKQCDTQVSKTCKRSYSCYCTTDKKGNRSCSTCYETKYYSVDSYNNAFCEGDNYCTSQKIEDIPEKDEDVKYARAYKFSTEDKSVSCSKNDLKFENCSGTKDEDGNPINCKPKYYYRRYKYKQLECSCTSTGGYISYKNTTLVDHPDENSYLFFETKNDCKKENKSAIVQVCKHVVTDTFQFHGVKWYVKNNYWTWYDKVGYWYNNAYVKPVKGNTYSNAKEVCKWACESKYGK